MINKNLEEYRVHVDPSSIVNLTIAQFNQVEYPDRAMRPKNTIDDPM